MPIIKKYRAIVDSDIPTAIARDAEVAAAIASHAAAVDPHPSLWSQMLATFARLAGGQQWLKNNSAISNASYVASQNHLELATDDGSNPIIGFHKGGRSATALYHAGYGANSLRIRNADGYDAELLHKVNHLDAVDPHPQYLTQLEGDERYIGNVKTKFLSGITSSAKATPVIAAHGLNITKIVGFSGIAQIYANNWLPFYDLGSPDQNLSLSVNETEFLITNINTTWVNAISKPFRIVVNYIN